MNAIKEEYLFKLSKLFSCWSRDDNLKPGPLAWSVKDCCGADLGMGFYARKVSGSRKYVSCGIGLSAGWTSLGPEG